jgi:hypothetical protein
MHSTYNYSGFVDLYRTLPRRHPPAEPGSDTAQAGVPVTGSRGDVKPQHSAASRRTAPD